MHVLTLPQPDALALFLRQENGNPLKRYVLDTRPPPFRAGTLLAIYASEDQIPWAGFLLEHPAAVKRLTYRYPDPLPFGALLGVVQLANPPSYRVPHPDVLAYYRDSPLEQAFTPEPAHTIPSPDGDVITSPNAYVHWDFGRRTLLPMPMPFRGREGLWRLRDTPAIRTLRAAWREGRG